MKLQVRVTANSRKESVTNLGDGLWAVRVNAPPLDGRANQRVMELIAEQLSIPKSRIRLVKGHKGKNKTFEVADV